MTLHHQKLDDTYEFDKIIKKEKLTLENCSKSDLIYNSNYSFYQYYQYSKKLDNLYLESRHSFLAYFFDDLDKLNKLKTQKRKNRIEKNMYNAASELYNDLPEISFDEYYELSDAKRKKIESKYDPD